MITVKDFMETVDYKITEGSEYLWKCFGDKAFRLDYWTGAVYTYNEQPDSADPNCTVSMVFDTVTQVVYQLEAHDYTDERSYRWTNPEFKDSYKAEVKQRLGEEDKDCAYDDVKFIELETTADILRKARAMVLGKKYDTRVEVPIELEDEELFRLMKLAHEQDITLNKLVENVLTRVIEQELKNGPVSGSI